MKAELLAPAGSMEGLKAVINAGADAVYIGGTMFGARAYADNPDTGEMLEAIDYTHIHGKKLYMTVNTLLKNRELYGQLYDFMAPFYSQGLDGVIIQDLGVLDFLKKEFPGLPLHASTQMAITGPRGAELLREAGVSRIVTARELSLKEIEEIHRQTGMEIESFVHGALCYCYSGLCLFSSMLGGRSGNRGRCAQPCRLPYSAYEGEKVLNSQKDAYLLSPKDMCTIELLPEILKAGVYSLKIEGRMKRPEYGAGVTAIYRKYLDLLEKNPKAYKVEQEDYRQLLDLYQRDGFNQGYYRQHNGRNMMAVFNEKEQNRRQKISGKRNEELFSRLRREYLEIKKQEKIHGNLILFSGAPAILDLDFRNVHVQVQGQVAQKAQKQPLTEERLRGQMEKTGDTPFCFEELEVCTDQQSFLPMQSLNQLRRQGLEQLQEEYLKQFKRQLGERRPDREPERETRGTADENPRLKDGLKIYAGLHTREQLKAALESPWLTGIYGEISLFSDKELEKSVAEVAQRARQTGKEFYLAMPHILREGRFEGKEEIIQRLGEQTAGFLVRNLEELGYLKKLGLLQKTICDSSVYSFNDQAQKFLENLGVKRTTLPLELNSREIGGKFNHNSEMVVYGYYPMMVSAQCLKKTCGRCDRKPGEIWLKDRKGQRFLTKSYCEFCYNVIYNSVPTGLLEEAGEIMKTGVQAVRLNFTQEGYRETGKLLELFGQAYGQKTQNKKKITRQEIPAFTRGHFRRGVE